MEPLVSVIMPAHNTREYIATAIASFLQQTECHAELIVIDDGSTDGTAEVVREFTDARIRLLVNERSHGPSYARNRALREARGHWIALLDSDDWYHPERLEMLTDLAEARGADLIADDLLMIQDGEAEPYTTLFTKFGIQIGEGHPMSLAEYITYDIPHIKPLMRRAFLQRYNLQYREDIRYGEDYLFYVDMLYAGAVGLLVPQALYYYRTRAGSLTQETLPLLAQGREMMRQLLASDIAGDPQIARILRRQEFKLRESEAYTRVLSPLHKRRLGQALLALAKHRYLWHPIAALTGRAIRRRLR